MIAAVATLGLGVPFGETFEEGARHVIEQEVVLEGEEIAQPLLKVLLDGSLVGKQPVQRPVEPIIVDLLRGQIQHVFKRGCAVKILRDVQLARRLAQPGHDQHGRHHRPGNLRAAHRHQLRA